MTKTKPSNRQIEDELRINFPVFEPSGSEPEDDEPTEEESE